MAPGPPLHDEAGGAVEGRAEVEILGERLTVRGQGTPDYIRGLADYLDRKITTVREEGRIREPTRLCVLAGLHVVDELFRSREREAGLAARVELLLDRLEACLRETGGPHMELDGERPGGA